MLRDCSSHSAPSLPGPLDVPRLPGLRLDPVGQGIRSRSSASPTTGASLARRPAPVRGFRRRPRAPSPPRPWPPCAGARRRRLRRTRSTSGVLRPSTTATAEAAGRLDDRDAPRPVERGSAVNSTPAHSASTITLHDDRHADRGGPALPGEVGERALGVERGPAAAHGVDAARRTPHPEDALLQARGAGHGGVLVQPAGAHRDRADRRGPARPGGARPRARRAAARRARAGGWQRGGPRGGRPRAPLRRPSGHCDAGSEERSTSARRRRIDHEALGHAHPVEGSDDGELCGLAPEARGLVRLSERDQPSHRGAG
jgi:hypothetical protein